MARIANSVTLFCQISVIVRVSFLSCQKGCIPSLHKGSQLSSWLKSLGSLSRRWLKRGQDLWSWQILSSFTFLFVCKNLTKRCLVIELSYTDEKKWAPSKKQIWRSFLETAQYALLKQILFFPCIVSVICIPFCRNICIALCVYPFICIPWPDGLYLACSAKPMPYSMILGPFSPPIPVWIKTSSQASNIPWFKTTNDRQTDLISFLPALWLWMYQYMLKVFQFFCSPIFTQPHQIWLLSACFCYQKLIFTS